MRAAVRDPTAEKNEFLRAMGCELVRVPDLLSDEGWAEAMAGCVGPGPRGVASRYRWEHAGGEDDLSSRRGHGARAALCCRWRHGEARRGHGDDGVDLRLTARKNPDHLWSGARQERRAADWLFKGKTAAEAKAWELAAQHSCDKYDVTTVHPAVVLGPLLPGQKASSTMLLLKQILDGAVVPSMFGLCSTTDVAAVHVAGLKEASTAGEKIPCLFARPVLDSRHRGAAEGARARAVQRCRPGRVARRREGRGAQAQEAIHRQRQGVRAARRRGPRAGGGLRRGGGGRLYKLSFSSRLTCC